MPDVGTRVPDEFAPARRRLSDRTRSDNNHRPVRSLGSRNHDAVAFSCAVASACPGTTTPSHRRSRFSKRIDVVLFAMRLEKRDRKSTRLNSSHSQISYAVFCLKKKKKTPMSHHLTHEITPC